MSYRPVRVEQHDEHAYGYQVLPYRDEECREACRDRPQGEEDGGYAAREAVHEAVKVWIRAQSKFQDDPLFMIKPVDSGIDTDSSSLDRKNDLDKL